MPRFRVAAQWTVVGFVTVEANSLDKAIEMIEDNVDDKYPLSAFNADYVDDSFEARRDLCEKLT